MHAQSMVCAAASWTGVAWHMFVLRAVKQSGSTICKGAYLGNVYVLVERVQQATVTFPAVVIMCWDAWHWRHCPPARLQSLAHGGRLSLAVQSCAAYLLKAGCG